MRLTFVIAVVVSLAFGGAPAFALDPRKAITQYGHDSWATRDGLPQNTVHDVVQAPDGYLWLATTVGLVRFDGERFTAFDKTNSGLAHDHIWGLFVARDGALWLSTDGGGAIRYKGGRFTTISTREGLAHDLVRTIREGPDGSIWIATNGGGVNRWKDGVLTKITKSDGLRSDLVWALHVDDDGTVWIGSNGGGLARYRDGAITSYTTADGLPNNTIWSLYRDSKGQLWVGTNAGLARFLDGRFIAYPTSATLLANPVRAIYEDKHGNLWVGTRSGILRLRGGRFDTFGARDGLSSDFVRAICEDREGSLWVGTSGGGLDRLRDGRFTVYGVHEGLSHDFVQPILEARDGSLWIGTNRQGLNRIRDGVITTYGLSGDPPIGAVYALAEARDGTLWIGTISAGLFRFDGRTFKRWDLADGMPREAIRAVLEARDGTLWIGTNDGLVARRGNRFVVYRVEDGLPGNVVSTLLEGRDGRIWVGTSAGLAGWEDGVFSTWTTRKGLGSNVVQSLYEDEGGTLWVGTNGGGLSRRDGDRFRTLTYKEGLADDVIHTILPDGLGNLWFTSHRGISRARQADLEAALRGQLRRVSVSFYDATDGMRSSECTGAFGPSSVRTRDGRLWFPTVRGAVSVDPRDDRRNTLVPPVVIEEVRADGTRVDPAVSGRLVAGTERLTFRYTGLSLLIPSKVRFRYRLTGFDDQWVDGGSNREVSYTHLPPGAYRFEVTAANNDGVWNATAAAFGFQLPPRLHQTWGFYLSCAAAALFLAWAFHQSQLRQLQSREEELARRVEERTGELQGEIVERARVEEALRKSEERYALAVRGANDGVWDWNRETDRIYFSARWKAILGYDDGEIGDAPSEWFSRVHHEDLDRLRSGIEAHCEGRIPHLEDEHRIRHRDGTYRWVLCRGFAVAGADGRTSRVVGVQTDVTDRRSYDALTSLPNRTLFVERLNRALLRVRHQPDYQIAVLFLDLDRFKVVNDSLGHLVGDRLLLAIAHQLEACVRPGDMIARFGGDEFAILVDGISSVDDAIRVSERIQKALQGAFVIEGNEVFTSASIGIATSATAYDSGEDLLRDADIAMYRAKATGRARFEIFDAAMRAHVTELLELESDLRRAVERQSFRLHYQPIVSLDTGALVGFEALVRWPHPRRGLVYPDAFIGVAEDTGLIVPLGYWVLGEACRQLRAWHDALPVTTRPSITVNVSGRQFLDKNLVRRIETILRETGLAAEHLILEITESVLLEAAGSADMLAELKALGVRLYIDDFGTGYSSLSYLHRFAVDALKIDRSFIAQIGTGGDSGALVRTIITLARNLEISAVAEGVESAEQVRELMLLGCDRAQGLYFAAALEAERAGALLTAGWHWELTRPTTWID